MGIKYQKNEKGVVLVSVLIIVAMISLVVSLMWQQQVANLNSTRNIIHTNQAISYLYSIEVWAQSILRNDDVKVDHLEEDWATIIPPIEVPNGKIHGKIVDMQAHFNINRLLSINKDATQVYLNPNYMNCLNKLNTSLEQDFMSDFMLEYINQQRPIQKFKHLSELRKVEGIEYKDYIKRVLTS
jgi:type II secretory pathway component PulK